MITVAIEHVSGFFTIVTKYLTSGSDMYFAEIIRDSDNETVHITNCYYNEYAPLSSVCFLNLNELMM